MFAIGTMTSHTVEMSAPALTISFSVFTNQMMS